MRNKFPSSLVKHAMKSVLANHAPLKLQVAAPLGGETFFHVSMSLHIPKEAPLTRRVRRDKASNDDEAHVLGESLTPCNNTLMAIKEIDPNAVASSGIGEAY